MLICWVSKNILQVLLLYTCHIVTSIIKFVTTKNIQVVIQVILLSWEVDFQAHFYTCTSGYVETFLRI